MKSFIVDCYKNIIQSRFLYNLLNRFFSLYDKVYRYRIELEKDLNSRSNNVLKIVFASKEVLNGPFKGLDYSGIKACGSQWHPKLLGSYEDILHKEIEYIIERKPELIIDIGCAEGYYAVGLARRLREKGTKIITIDPDSFALQECKKLAHQNGVIQLISFYNQYDNSINQAIDYSFSTAIICDCEGCESTIFNNDNPKLLQATYLIIELHEFVDKDIERKVSQFLSNTHAIRIIQDRPRDLRKYSQINHLKYYQKRFAVNEHRPMRMKWLVAESKKL